MKEWDGNGQQLLPQNQHPEPPLRHQQYNFTTTLTKPSLMVLNKMTEVSPIFRLSDLVV